MHNDNCESCMQLKQVNNALSAIIEELESQLAKYMSNDSERT